MRYEVLKTYRKGGAEIAFRGTLDECIEWCEKEYEGSEFNDPDNLFYGHEEHGCEIFEDLDFNQNFN